MYRKLTKSDKFQIGLIIAYTIIVLLFLSFFVSSARADQSKYLKPFSKDWLADRTLKYGTLISYCTAQSLTGITEGYKFNGNRGYLMNENNYHAYQTAMRASWIGAGFITQATIRSPHRTWIGKIKRIIGSACIARNAFEWSYKWQRYNNPFDTQPEHNRNAVVYFGIRNGGVVDLYFSTGKVTTPLTDIAFLVLGLWLWE